MSRDPIKIKRGATFKAMLIFTEDEWAFLYPWDIIESKVMQGEQKYALTVETIDVENRSVSFVSSNTGSWDTCPGDAWFDIWITKGDDLIPIPVSVNVHLKIVEGVTY